MGRDGSAPTPAAWDACPEDEILAAFLEGGLAPSEAERVRDHLAICTPCRRIGAHLAEAVGPRAGALRAAAPRRAVLLAAAAVLLVALALLLRWPGPRAERVRGDASPAAVLARLAREDPALMEGVRLFGPEDLREALALPAERGSVLLRSPRGLVLASPRRFDWATPPGVGRWRVAVRGAGGELLLETEADAPPLVLPPDALALEPGAQALWTVEGRSPLAPWRGAATFAVADPALGARWTRLQARLDADLPEALRARVALHAALSWGLLDEARRLQAAAGADEGP